LVWSDNSYDTNKHPDIIVTDIDVIYNLIKGCGYLSQPKNKNEWNINTINIDCPLERKSGHYNSQISGYFTGNVEKTTNSVHMKLFIEDNRLNGIEHFISDAVDDLNKNGFLLYITPRINTPWGTRKLDLWLGNLDRSRIKKAIPYTKGCFVDDIIKML